MLLKHWNSPEILEIEIFNAMIGNRIGGWIFIIHNLRNCWKILYLHNQEWKQSDHGEFYVEAFQIIWRYKISWFTIYI